jgi:hypothetical protein
MDGARVPLFVVPIMLADPVVRLLFNSIVLAVLLILLIVTWYVLRLIRANVSKTELRPADYLESFRKLHEEGELTNEEFRIVRGLLSLQFARSPDEPKSDYSLLNKIAPSQPMDRLSGKIPKD